MEPDNETAQVTTREAAPDHLKDCWVCGAPGVYAGYMALSCELHDEGSVTWRTFETPRKALPVEASSGAGNVVKCVDFTVPGVLSSPA